MDYWSEDFDTSKNCQQEIKIAELRDKASLAYKQDHQRWRYITVDFGNINGYKWPHGMI